MSSCNCTGACHKTGVCPNAYRDQFSGWSTPYRQPPTHIETQIIAQLNRIEGVLDGTTQTALVRVRKIARRRFLKMQEMRKTIKRLEEENKQLKENNNGGRG